MTRTEWLAGAVLALLTAFSLAFAPSGEQPSAVASAHVSPTTAPPSTSTALPTGTPTRTRRPTLTPLPTLTATPTETPTATSLPTVTTEPTPTAWPFNPRPDLDRYIYIDQAVQHMYVFEHGNLVRDIPCSTGLPDPDKYTEAWSGRVGQYWGTFFAFDVYADEAWYLYKSAGSILVHSLPYTLENGYKIYQDRDALGVRPSSHGCVRIAPEDAAWFTAWDPEGVLCTVTDPYLERWR